MIESVSNPKSLFKTKFYKIFIFSVIDGEDLFAQSPTAQSYTIRAQMIVSSQNIKMCITFSSLGSLSLNNSAVHYFHRFMETSFGAGQKHCKFFAIYIVNAIARAIDYFATHVRGFNSN